MGESPANGSDCGTGEKPWARGSPIRSCSPSVLFALLGATCRDPRRQAAGSYSWMRAPTTWRRRIVRSGRPRLSTRRHGFETAVGTGPVVVLDVLGERLDDRAAAEGRCIAVEPGRDASGRSSRAWRRRMAEHYGAVLTLSRRPAPAEEKNASRSAARTQRAVQE
jgi:hypothetical protein